MCEAVGSGGIVYPKKMDYWGSDHKKAKKNSQIPSEKTYTDYGNILERSDPVPSRPKSS